MLHVIPSDAISCILQHADTILMESWSTNRMRQSSTWDPVPEVFLLDRMTSCMISEITNKNNHNKTNRGNIQNIKWTKVSSNTSPNNGENRFKVNDVTTSPINKAKSHRGPTGAVAQKLEQSPRAYKHPPPYEKW